MGADGAAARIVCKATSEPSDLLTAAAQSCFWTLPKTWLGQLCRHLKLPMGNGNLYALLTVLVRRALKLTEDMEEELLAILGLRLQRVVANEARMASLEAECMQGCLDSGDKEDFEQKLKTHSSTKADS